ncbi:S8 family serine peptidase [Clostridium sp. BNL1100]|uniref:S8 family serine peptidase n=1 Tax=Clostridium sp. BNL1100 TaxID=755731 RepID=UPI00024A7288|nr:S8 family serine peptidase [Clostridium sp. BNL1100]AEY65929.1 subtilisin-like serine protease [Clostridium sp. BNL1100]
MRKSKLVKLFFILTLVFTIVGTQTLTFAKPLNEAAKSESPAFKLTKSPDSKLFVNLKEKIDESSDDDEIPVTVLFNKKLSDTEFSSIEKLLGNPKLKHKFDIIPGVALNLTKKQISQLEKSDLIQQVEYDAPVHATLNTASSSFGVTQAKSDFNVNGDADNAPTTYSTSDVVVAVIDTGIDSSHVDLDGGKVIAWKDWVNNKTTPYDDNGHGTHVSGIVAGTGEGNSSYKGVAPGASLIGLKVLDSAGSGTMSNVTAAIDWAVTNKAKYNIRIISLSLGTDASSDGTDSTSVAINNAFDAGIVPVVAAGNAGPGKATIGSPGAASKALTVGAFADVGEKGFFLADFSSRGLTADGRVKPDIAAPGYQITSVQANSTNKYIAYSGTSMATPFTSGTAALILDANPSLTASQVVNIITSTAQDWGPAGQDLDYGFGRLDGYEAVKKAGNFTGTGPSVPNHIYKAESLAKTNTYDEYTISIPNTTYPIAITLIHPNWSSSQDFDVYLYNPSGTEVASSETATRQETISYTPTTAGTYKIKVLSYKGSGSYFFDVSSSAATITQTTNQ